MPRGYPRASGGARTHDLLITNQLLCQLSYAGANPAVTDSEVREFSNPGGWSNPSLPFTEGFPADFRQEYLLPTRSLLTFSEILLVCGDRQRVAPLIFLMPAMSSDVMKFHSVNPSKSIQALPKFGIFQFFKGLTLPPTPAVCFPPAKSLSPDALETV